MQSTCCGHRISEHSLSLGRDPFWSQLPTLRSDQLRNQWGKLFRRRLVLPCRKTLSFIIQNLSTLLSLTWNVKLANIVEIWSNNVILLPRGEDILWQDVICTETLSIATSLHCLSLLQHFKICLCIVCIHFHFLESIYHELVVSVSLWAEMVVHFEAEQQEKQPLAVGRWKKNKKNVSDFSHNNCFLALDQDLKYDKSCSNRSVPFEQEVSLHIVPKPAKRAADGIC